MSGWNGSMGPWYEHLAEQQRRENRAKRNVALFVVLVVACGLVVCIWGLR